MTEWFENRGTGVSKHVDDERVLIVGDYIPDWVHAPADLPTAESGRKLRVISHRNDVECPKCKTRLVRHLVLEENYFVAECNPNPPGCGFVWYRL